MFEEINIPDEFKDLLTVVMGCAKKFRPVVLENLGDSERVNIHGERSLELDLFANDLIKDVLTEIGCVFSMASEEEDEILPVNKDGKYIVCFDPLDGSSLVGTNQAIAMVFGVYLKDDLFNKPLRESLQLAFYVHIGQVNSLVFSYDDKVYELEFFEDLHVIRAIDSIEDNAKVIAPGNVKLFADKPYYKDYFLERIESGLRLRYFGCLISDIHHIVSKSNGIFIYLSDEKYLNGKLRLLYEVAPVARILENISAKAINEDGKNILDLIPSSIHENSTLVAGSGLEVDLFSEMVLNRFK